MWQLWKKLKHTASASFGNCWSWRILCPTITRSLFSSGRTSEVKALYAGALYIAVEGLARFPRPDSILNKEWQRGKSKLRQKTKCFLFQIDNKCKQQICSIWICAQRRMQKFLTNDPFQAAVLQKILEIDLWVHAERATFIPTYPGGNFNLHSSCDPALINIFQITRRRMRRQQPQRPWGEHSPRKDVKQPKL